MERATGFEPATFSLATSAQQKPANRNHFTRFRTIHNFNCSLEIGFRLKSSSCVVKYEQVIYKFSPILVPPILDQFLGQESSLVSHLLQS